MKGMGSGKEGERSGSTLRTKHTLHSGGV